MVIKLKIDARNINEQNLVINFVEYFVHRLQTEILQEVDYKKIKHMESGFLNAIWVMWKKKNPPKSINLVRVVNVIVNNIIYKEIKKNEYIIYINPAKRLRGTYNTLDQIARFLNYGSLNNKPTLFMSKIFCKYQMNADKYWKSYRQIKLHKIDMKETMVIT